MANTNALPVAQQHARPGKAPRTGTTQGYRAPLATAPVGTVQGSAIVAYGNPCTVVATNANRYGAPAVKALVWGTQRYVYLLPAAPRAVAWAPVGVHTTGNAPLHAPQPLAHGHYYGHRGAYAQTHL